MNNKKLYVFLCFGGLSALLWARDTTPMPEATPAASRGEAAVKGAPKEAIKPNEMMDFTEVERPSSKRLRRAEAEDKDFVFVYSRGNVFETSRVMDYRILREDSIVEIRNPRTGRRVITIMKASALPDEEMDRRDLQYTIMEGDTLSIQVDKNDEKERIVRVDYQGAIEYPLIGNIKVKGLTEPQLEQALVEKFTPYIYAPTVNAKVTVKSPLARIMVVGTGFRDFEGHEKILDILGPRYLPSEDNIYDKVCVIRRYPDASFKCIVVDMESIFKYYDFTENIPLRAGDIIHVKKKVPLLGYRFKWWWKQVLGWVNEVDSAASAIQSVQNIDFGRQK